MTQVKKFTTSKNCKRGGSVLSDMSKLAVPFGLVAANFHLNRYIKSKALSTDVPKKEPKEPKKEPKEPKKEPKKNQKNKILKSTKR